MRRRWVLPTVVLVCVCPGAPRATGAEEVIPRDGESAKRAVWQAIKGQGLRTSWGPVQEDQLDLIPTRDTWLGDHWVVGVRNKLAPLVGGPPYPMMYLVGTSLAAGRDVRLGTSYVTTDFRSAFEWRVRHRPPTTEAEAFEIAKCYAWLSTHTRPERLKVLRSAEDVSELHRGLTEQDPQLAKSFSAQIAPPRTQVHRVVGLKPKTRVFTVEFAAQSQDCRDIHFWHMEIGEYVFSVSRRPVVMGSRVGE